MRRRAQHEPLQYIVGEMEFFGAKLKVDRRALIPRPETERLVELVGLSGMALAPTKILDLGTGSGAIALALALLFPAAAITAVDRSEDALALARENAAATGLAERVTFLASDWFAAVPAGPFEIIVANPPYLSAEETAQTAPEVRGFEPLAALTAAEDGLADLARIIREAPRFLAPGGLLALETGVAHHARLLALAAAAGFSRTESKQDLSGRDRYFFAFR